MSSSSCRRARSRCRRCWKSLKTALLARAWCARNCRILLLDRTRGRMVLCQRCCCRRASARLGIVYRCRYCLASRRAVVNGTPSASWRTNGFAYPVQGPTCDIKVNNKRIFNPCIEFGIVRRFRMHRLPRLFHRSRSLRS